MKEDELTLLKRDLVSGNIDRAIKKRLENLKGTENLDDKHCPVCGGKIDANSYKLEFGKDYLRKRAYFDGQDCLVYFVNTKLKKQSQRLHYD